MDKKKKNAERLGKFFEQATEVDGSHGNVSRRGNKLPMALANISGGKKKIAGQPGKFAGRPGNIFG